MVEKRYGEKVFQTKIRENIAIAEMPLSGQTIFEYDPKSNGATDYRTLTDEIISREDHLDSLYRCSTRIARKTCVAH